MTIDFGIDPEIRELKEKVRTFIADTVIPYERDDRQGEHGPTQELVSELQVKAAEANLLSPHIAIEHGGLGLDHRGRSIIFEEAGYSTLGPLALNISAPDEGTAHLLAHAGTAEQIQQWLVPHAAGDLRTCFAMSEPSPGAGSDPSALKTTATKSGGGWLINGDKKWITGALGASACIVMATHSDSEPGKPRATMFLIPMSAPGITITEELSTLDSHFVGGHASMNFKDVRVEPEHILGEESAGFRYAQIRLAPARLTHCMRHLGSARRAHDIATEYVRDRQGFGGALASHEGVSYQLADNEIDIRTSRLMIWHTAWLLDQGERCNEESSQSKVAVSEAVWRIVDRCVQLMGGSGVSDETVVRQIFLDARPFRVYDGPSEVHRWSLGKKIAKRGAPVPF